MHRAAMKKRWKYTKKFAEDMYKFLGVRFLLFVAMETPAGSVNTGIMDFNDGLGGGASYAAKHSNWKTEGIDLDSWNGHGPQPGLLQFRQNLRRYLNDQS